MFFTTISSNFRISSHVAGSCAGSPHLKQNRWPQSHRTTGREPVYLGTPHPHHHQPRHQQLHIRKRLLPNGLVARLGVGAPSCVRVQLDEGAREKRQEAVVVAVRGGDFPSVFIHLEFARVIHACGTPHARNACHQQRPVSNPRSPWSHSERNPAYRQPVQHSGSLASNQGRTNGCRRVQTCWLVGGLQHTRRKLAFGRQ